MRTRSIAVTLTLLAGLVAVSSAHADAAPSPTAPTVGASVSSDTVTLITGDVVRLDTSVDGRQRAAVVRAADRRAGIHTFTSGGDVYVEPAPVSALLAAGRL